MKFGILQTAGKSVPAVFDGKSAYSLIDWVDAASFQDLLARPEELHAAGKAALETGRAISFEWEELGPPVLRPRKILGIGLNYLDHAKETNREPPKIQTWFVKQVTALNSPFGDVDLPIVSSDLDYEVELVVVIGKGGRHIPAARAHEAIAGYTIGCDYSVRDWQKATPTMNMGKSFDTHAPIGPWIVTADELGNLDDLRLRTLVNGETRQDGCVGDLIHKVPDLIAHLSQAFTLEPGDLLFTGTPAGVGVAHSPPKFLKAGDIVRVEIDGIGHIQNRIVPETVPASYGH